MFFINNWNIDKVRNFVKVLLDLMIMSDLFGLVKKKYIFYLEGIVKKII